MAKARPNNAGKFGPSEDEFKEEPVPIEYPPLPDITQLVEDIERSVNAVADVELRVFLAIFNGLRIKVRYASVNSG